MLRRSARPATDTKSIRRRRIQRRSGLGQLPWRLPFWLPSSTQTRERARTRATGTAFHVWPRAVRIPCALPPAAKSRSVRAARPRRPSP